MRRSFLIVNRTGRNWQLSDDVTEGHAPSEGGGESPNGEIDLAGRFSDVINT